MNQLNDYDAYFDQRIDGIRGLIELNFDEATGDDVVPVGALFELYGLKFVVLPTLGDGMLSLDVTGWRHDDQVLSETHTIFDKES